MVRSAVVLSLPCLFLLTGCGVVGDRAEFDSLVEEVWLESNGGQLIDAAEFIDGGGKVATGYDEATERDITQTVVRSFAEAVEESFGTEVYAYVQDDTCIELLIDRDTGDASESDIRATIDDAEGLFDGAIKSEWGHRWVSVMFMSEGAAEAFDSGL